MIRTHILLTLLVGAGMTAVLWRARPPVWTAMQTLGTCLLVFGFVFWTIARFQLGKSFAVTAQAKHLVTHGLYSKIRNPIYVFGSCVLAGVILVVGRPVWLLIFLAIVPLQIWRARKESAVLEAAFGDEYRKYRAGTWF
jgi:protein-S-isoprenylcysteine O-methyltransferase Ste14